jgi:hypothetical protein
MRVVRLMLCVVASTIRGPCRVSPSKFLAGATWCTVMQSKPLKSHTCPILLCLGSW